MDTYNYYEEVLDDLKRQYEEYKDADCYEEAEAIREAIEAEDNTELEELLHDMAFCDDSVTGNASGSYYCNTWKAEEALCHNWDMVQDVAEVFGLDLNEETPESLDVAIRCHMLPLVCSELAAELIG